MKYIWLLPLAVVLLASFSTAQSTYTVADAKNLIANYSGTNYNIQLPSVVTTLIGNNNQFYIAVYNPLSPVSYIGYAVESNGKLTQISTIEPQTSFTYEIDIQLSALQQIVNLEQSNPSDTQAIQKAIMTDIGNSQIMVVPYDPTILEQIETKILQIAAMFLQYLP